MKEGKISIAVLMICLALITSLAMSNSLVVGAEYPAQAIWVEPSLVDDLNLSDTFTVDVMVNITDPPGAGTSLCEWEYKLFWNQSVINVVNITNNDPWTQHLWANETGIWPTPPRAGLGYHWLAYSWPAYFTGVASLCTYEFHVKRARGSVDFVGDLDIHDDFLYDDIVVEIFHDTYDGQYRIPAAPSLVGSIWVPVDNLALLAPYIALTSTILVATAATAIYVKHVKHRKKKQ